MMAAYFKPSRCPPSLTLIAPPPSCFLSQRKRKQQMGNYPQFPATKLPNLYAATYILSFSILSFPSSYSLIWVTPLASLCVLHFDSGGTALDLRPLFFSCVFNFYLSTLLYYQHLNMSKTLATILSSPPARRNFFYFFKENIV